MSVVPKEMMEIMVKLLSPFAPHLADELWEMLGNKTDLAFEKWPEFDEKALLLSNVNIENVVLPGMPYPRDFILSAVSIAFSKDHVVIIDKILSPHLARFIILPFETSRPIHL